MNIFLTGANGYLGRNFIKEAIKYNHKIFATTSKKNYNKFPVIGLDQPNNKNRKDEPIVFE